MGALTVSVSLSPSRETPLRLRHIESNQLTLMAVDLERMLDESHPARSAWEFVGGLDPSLFEEKVTGKAGDAGHDRDRRGTVGVERATEGSTQAQTA